MERPILTERTELAGIPVLHVRNRELHEPAPTVIFYHGWSSRKENHLIMAESLAVEGLRVILPDARRHGERDPFPDYDALEALVYFWSVVEESIAEAGAIAEAALAAGLAAPGRLGIAGSSMGGMIAAGALAGFPEFRAAVLCNSCPSLEWLADRQREERGFPLLCDEERLAFRKFDPEALLDRVAPRPLLMLHGDADTSVPVAGVRRFAGKARSHYAGHPDSLCVQETAKLNHHVTADQILQTRTWFKQHL